jgi:hypothetical protein
MLTFLNNAEIDDTYGILNAYAKDGILNIDVNLWFVILIKNVALMTKVIKAENKLIRLFKIHPSTLNFSVTWQH